MCPTPLGAGHAQSPHQVCSSGQTALRHILRRHPPRFAHNLRPHVCRAARRQRAFRASDRSETNVHPDVTSERGPGLFQSKAGAAKFKGMSVARDCGNTRTQTSRFLQLCRFGTRHSPLCCASVFGQSRSVDLAAATKISVPTGKRCPTASPGMFREVIV